MRLIKSIIVALVLLASPAVLAQAAPPAPTRTFGGCNGPGTICFGPSALLSVTAYNLTAKTVEASFSPGLGYGVTFFQKQWYATGLDVFVSMKTGPYSTISYSVIGKFANYLRIGVAREVIGGNKSWYIPLGVGADIP